MWVLRLLDTQAPQEVMEEQRTELGAPRAGDSTASSPGLGDKGSPGLSHGVIVLGGCGLGGSCG